MATAEAFVVSDLHLGAGAADPDLEDFDQDDQFAAFVAQITGPGVTLFINGDFIDFAQIPPYDVPQPHHLLWTEAASLVKVQSAVDAEVKRLPATERAIVATPGKVDVGARAGLVEEPAATLGIFREDREVRAARARFAEPGVTHVVYGHTHEVVDGALEGRLFNPGTWLPRLDLSSPMVTAKIKAHGLTLDMLQDPALYIADRQVVHIIPDPPRMTKVQLVSVA